MHRLTRFYKWEQLTETKKKDFYNSVRSEDGKTIKYQNIEDVKPLWHGKLIYEGDILRINNKEIGCVEWYGTHAEFRIQDYGVLDKYLSDTYKVIGNIYSTPELLEGKE